MELVGALCCFTGHTGIFGRYGARKFDLWPCAGQKWYLTLPQVSLK